jgi:hypothetical protein
MSSPNPYPEDELDHLVRGALEAQVSGKEPPNRVWKQIKAELQTDGSPPSRQSRVSWSALGIQAALTLVLVTIGGVAIVGPNGLRGSVYDVSPSGTMAYVDERGVSPAAPNFDDQAELRSLKAASRSRPEAQPDAEPNDHPPLMVPRDFPPHAMSPEGRALESEFFMRRLAVEEQNLPRSGPYGLLK